MRRSRCRSSLIVLTAGFLVVAAGCSVTENDIVAPDESTITINPTSVTWTVPTGTLCDPTVFATNEFFVTVRNGDSAPLNNLEVRLTLSNSGLAFLDAAGNFIPSDASGFSAITLVTDDNGVVTVKVVNLLCKLRGDLSASSGTAFEIATVEVTEGT